MTIINQNIHDNLTILGYTHIHHECTFEDYGDPENGPELEGDPEWDCYENDVERIIVNQFGQVEFREDIDHAFETWVEMQNRN